MNDLDTVTYAERQFTLMEAKVLDVYCRTISIEPPGAHKSGPDMRGVREAHVPKQAARYSLRS
jgi:hypothetical protein